MKPADKAPGGGRRAAASRQQGGKKAAGGRPKGGRGAARTCPICGRSAAHTYRPFCSRRCADIDLGRWLGGRYVIPGEPASGGEGGAEDA